MNTMILLFISGLILFRTEIDAMTTQNKIDNILIVFLICFAVPVAIKLIRWGWNYK